MWNKKLIENYLTKTYNTEIVFNFSAHFSLGAEQNKLWMNSLNQYRTS